MKQNEADRLRENLTSKFGLPIKTSLGQDSDGQFISIQPVDIHPSEGFVIRVKIGWRTLSIDFVLGKFAAEMLQHMSESSQEKKQIFSEVCREIINQKVHIVLKINDVMYDPTKPLLWPSEWKFFAFSLTKTPVEINTDDHGLTEKLINLWVERFYGCIIPLLPIEDVEIAYSEAGLPEGALTQIWANRYERSKYNRALCINFHGYDCKACEKNMAETYGRIAEGYIHVHHVVPVSQLGPNYMINPLLDLVPVCPNCHAMLHKRNPPYTIDELKAIIKNKTI